MSNTFNIGDFIFDEYQSICRVLDVFDNKVVYEYVFKLKPDGSKDYSKITSNIELCKRMDFWDSFDIINRFIK